MATNESSKKSSTSGDVNLVVGVTPTADQSAVTARKAGGLLDTKLPVSPTKSDVSVALQNLAKAINIGLQPDFLENELEKVYRAARVHDGMVQIMHKDYIGLGDGILAQVGRVAKSFQLTLQGPDPASPEGKKWIEEHGRSAGGGVLHLLGRKLDLVQEYEDKVPTYVAQMLDRLEAANMITGWDRDEWDITTEVIGLDVLIRPVDADGK